MDIHLTSINPSYFGVNYRGTIGFDPYPYGEHGPGRHSCTAGGIPASDSVALGGSGSGGGSV